MEKADADLMHQLFRENNELRSKVNVIQRELFNKTTQFEEAEDEIRAYKEKIDIYEKQTSGEETKDEEVVKKATVEVSGRTGALGFSKDSQEAIQALQRKTQEVKNLKDEIHKLQNTIQEQNSAKNYAEREMNLSKEELGTAKKLLEKTEKRVRELESIVEKDSKSQAAEEILRLRTQLEESETKNSELRKELTQIVTEANQRYNEQQNQLLGIETVVENIRIEYSEYMELTKLEGEAQRKNQQEQYETLRITFEQCKRDQLDSKRKMLEEYEGLLLSMQAQFDEYRTTAEFLFNSELARFEDELSTQAARYEQEIMYIIQMKDKFYADMMVAKDAKIMSLIEGSDLQSIIQKHEVDIDLIRREFSKELERVKSSQESEQQSIVEMLQRQNSGLEEKIGKLHQQLKSNETKMKDLMATIEGKNREMVEKDEARAKIEADFQQRIEELNNKLNNTVQDRERLRHKIIRMKMMARGEGEMSVENMLRRITKETSELHKDVGSITNKYHDAVTRNEELEKDLKQKRKLVDFLEKEVRRRSEEYKNMSRTFEDFLTNRARQAQRERSGRLMKLHEDTVSKATNALKPTSAPSDLMVTSNLNTLKINIPNQEKPKKHVSESQLADDNSLKMELQKGYNYLRRFKTLSRAFETGDMKTLRVPNSVFAPTTTNDPKSPEKALRPPAPWESLPIYKRLENAVANASIGNTEKNQSVIDAKLYTAEKSYEEHMKDIEHPRPLIYEPRVSDSALDFSLGSNTVKLGKQGNKPVAEMGIKLYQKPLSDIPNSSTRKIIQESKSSNGRKFGKLPKDKQNDGSDGALDMNVVGIHRG